MTVSAKVAVVTGGSQGLGREVARRLLAQGYQVALFGRSRSSLDESVAELGGDVVGVTVDVGDEASVAEGFAEVDRMFAPPNVLVNSAGIYQPFPIEDADAERIAPLVQTNFCGAIFTMRQAVLRMRKIGGGDIVNVSSDSVQRGTPFFSVYTSTKAALETMTALMSEELREDNIRCTIFRVGRMHSHGTAQSTLPPELRDRWLERNALTGSGYWVGSGMQPSSAASALVNLLLTPADARVEMVEVRSA